MRWKLFRSSSLIFIMCLVPTHQALQRSGRCGVADGIQGPSGPESAGPNAIVYSVFSTVFAFTKKMD